MAKKKDKRPKQSTPAQVLDALIRQVEAAGIDYMFIEDSAPRDDLGGAVVPDYSKSCTGYHVFRALFDIGEATYVTSRVRDIISAEGLTGERSLTTNPVGATPVGYLAEGNKRTLLYITGAPVTSNEVDLSQSNEPYVFIPDKSDTLRDTGTPHTIAVQGEGYVLFPNAVEVAPSTFLRHDIASDFTGIANDIVTLKNGRYLATGYDNGDPQGYVVRPYGEKVILYSDLLMSHDAYAFEALKDGEELGATNPPLQLITAAQKMGFKVASEPLPGGGWSVIFIKCNRT